MNVICMFTKKVINNITNTPSTGNEALDSLIERLSADDSYSGMVEKALEIQGTINTPYYGDCTHSIHPKKHPSIKFPLPNLSCEPQRILGKGILDGSECDPFMHMDKKYKSTHRIMKHAVVIYTRSDLVAHDDYISELNSGVKIYFVYDNTCPDYNMLNERGTPSYKRRLKACEKLKSLGFNAVMKKVSSKALLKAL